MVKIFTHTVKEIVFSGYMKGKWISPMKMSNINHQENASWNCNRTVVDTHTNG